VLSELVKSCLRFCIIGEASLVTVGGVSTLAGFCRSRALIELHDACRNARLSKRDQPYPMA
jgi:hypothetical protein